MTRKAATVWGRLILTWPVLFCASYAQQLVVIRGGTLIDGNGGPPVPNATVLIEKDRIKEIRTTPLDPVPAIATVIEAAGKFLIPGLHDSHVHYKDWMPPLYINHGVTTMHDIGNSPEQWILAQREMFQKEKIVGPRLYAAVYRIEGPTSASDHPNLEWVKSLEGRPRDTYEQLAIPFFNPDPVKEEELIKFLVQKEEVYLEADWV